MASILQQRKSLHRQIKEQNQNQEILELQLSQLQALANIGTSTCMIAHELNNLLTPILNYVTLASMHPDDPGLTRKALEKTEQNCKRAVKVMESILEIAKSETDQKQICNLNEMIEQVFSCLARDFSKDSIEVQIDIPEILTVNVVPIKIQQMFMNLIINARDAMLETGGILKIAAAAVNADIEINVSDTGCGIKSENLDKVFQPFFTTKKNHPVKSGSGLGLLFCKKVIEEHQGMISVESEPDQGTVFTIIIPSS